MNYKKGFTLFPDFYILKKNEEGKINYYNFSKHLIGICSNRVKEFINSLLVYLVG
jgi:hypothetical protein